MMNSKRRQQQSMRGFTLTEILVALAVFTIILIGALVIYDKSNRVFKESVEAADVQQNTRVAFDRLVADIRMAGYDYDRDGVPTGSAGSVWAPGKAYNIGNMVSPTVANGFTYRVSAVSGASPFTSGTTEPTWPTVTGNTVVDNEITWKAEPGINQYQQPDEQIEFAGARAITIRGNLDYETDAANGNGREPTLETPQFAVVTTGNDEIVTYALRSNNGPNNDAVSFYADVPDREAHPGGRAEQLVTIDDVDFSNANPPYTLYRFTLDAAGDIVESPVANNIRSMNFTYYSDATGTSTPMVISAADAGGGQYNPNNVAASAVQRALRAQIKSVRVQLIGMNEIRDPEYRNPAEVATSPVINNRTYTLESLVVPRNIGKQGFREPQSAAPGKPVLRWVDYGYCGIAIVELLQPAPDPNAGTVEQYAILYDTVNNGNFRYVKQIGPNIRAPITLDPNNVTYYITVAAINSYGSARADGFVQVKLQNRTTPQAPASMTASGATPATEQPNQITVTWPNVALNVSGKDEIRRAVPGGGDAALPPPPVPPESGGQNPAIAPGEIIGYRVYRSTTEIFTPDASNEVQTSAPNDLSIGLTDVTFIDRSAAGCVNYYYKVRAIEACDLSSENTGPANVPSQSATYPLPSAPGILGRASSTATPGVPTGVNAVYTDPINCSGDGNPGVANGIPRLCDVQLSWNSVRTDNSTPATPLAVAQYQVTRVRETETGPNTNVYVNNGSTTFVVTDGNTLDADVSYVDPAVIVKEEARRSRYRYSVKAMSCSNIGAASLEALFPCTTTAVPVITATNTIDGDGLTAGSAWLMDGSGTSILVGGTNISSVQATLSDGFGGYVELGTDLTAPFEIPIGETEEGAVYQVELNIRDTAGCVTSLVRWVELSTASGCCLAAFADDSLVVEYTPGTSFVRIRLRNQCGDPLDVSSFTLEATLPAGTVITALDFPAAAGGVVTKVWPGGGSATFPLPAGAKNPIPVETATTALYEVVVRFNTPLTGASSPITNVCVGYTRAGIDTQTQNCRIIPEPLNFNSCF